MARIAGERQAARFVVGRVDARVAIEAPARSRQSRAIGKCALRQNNDLAAAIAAFVNGAGSST